MALIARLEFSGIRVIACAVRTFAASWHILRLVEINLRQLVVQIRLVIPESTDDMLKVSLIRNFAFLLQKSNDFAPGQGFDLGLVRSEDLAHQPAIEEPRRDTDL
jgi:hypothetical protein